MPLPTSAPRNCNRPLEGLNYSALRPFAKWQGAHLEAAIGGWLQLEPLHLELATLALDELTHRGADLNARMKFARANVEPVAWLTQARQAVLAGFPETVLEKSGTGTVYVLLRSGYTRENGFYGAYVGSTRKSLDQRFREHAKGGAKAARGLARYAIEPLYSLCLPLNPVPARRAKLEEWETRLHECLAPIVPKVTGDVAY
ncbi:hypothetical protein GCM10011316_18980 [Roseibium aquae]|uniref:GIY-YIG domain-containing protein n=1 Tax=Roseibium aquae TaxID=1323746 RepID=A0A916TLC7_9HYPH|nr:hypothetical protein [Roseibium aquae]GGB47049.1 hypothetical protein GCM10011316_18980 [Roseibium aquae]